MNFRSLAIATGALSLAATPAIAEAANADRASAPVAAALGLDDFDDEGGFGGILIALLAASAIIAGIVIAAGGGDDEPVSP